MASTSLIADMKTVIANGPNAATLVKANAPAGPLMDYQGNTRGLLNMFDEITLLLAKVVTDTDSTDSVNLGLINGVVALLNGTSAPSTTAIADMKTVIANGPNAATLVKANAPAGPLMDYQGNTRLALLKLKESSVLIGKVVTDTDSTDSVNLGLLNGIVAVLV